MNKHPLLQVCFALSGLALAGTAMAQDAAMCPQLPANSGLTA